MPDSPPVFAEAIRTLLADDARRTAMGIQGRRVAEAFTEERIAHRLIEIYETVMRESGVPASRDA